MAALITAVAPETKQEKNGFQLEAAKAVMQSGSPGEALDKTRLLVGMFPDRLPKNFMHEVDISPLFDKYDAAAKKLSASDLVELWKVLFADPWPRTPEMAAFLANVDHHQSP